MEPEKISVSVVWRSLRMEDQVFEINDSLKLNISNYIRYGSKTFLAFRRQIYTLT